MSSRVAAIYTFENHIQQLRKSQDSSLVTIFGHAGALGTSQQTIWDSTGIASVQFSSTTVDVASTDANDTSAGSGARTVLVVGLDADGAIQTESVTLAGQTEQTTTSSWIAINNVVVTTAGASKMNEGDIWVGNGTFTAGVPATKFYVAAATFSRGTTFVYTIPAGKEMLALQTYSMFGASAKDVEITYFQDNGLVKTAIFDITQPEGAVTLDPIGGQLIAERSTLTVEGAVSTGTGAQTVFFVGQLLDV